MQHLARSSDASVKLSISAALSRLGGLGFQAQSAAKATAGLVEGMDEAVRGALASAVTLWPAVAAIISVG